MAKSIRTKRIKSILAELHNKRAKIVISRILAKGFITTEELEKKYGYNHPPRAARDVREAGIPLETFRVKSSDGKRSIAAYRFDDLSKIKEGRLGGRITLPKEFKEELYALSGGRCYICNTKYDARYLQVDHKVPYGVKGDTEANPTVSDYALICGSCNRAKSWSCEHCINWKEIKDPKICMNCYWASPDSYAHMAMTPSRRVDIVWSGKEVKQFDKLKKKLGKRNIATYIKDTLEQDLTRDARD